jgi:hypothetical protein
MREHSETPGTSRRDVFRFAAATAAGLALPRVLSAASGPLRSAGVMTFGAGNVLFVGDIAGAKIHAFALRDKDLTSQTDVISGNFHNFEGRDHVAGLDQKLAALFAQPSTKLSSTTWRFINPPSRSSFRWSAAAAPMPFRRS